MKMSYVFLTIAIACEVAASLGLVLTEQFTRLLPSVFVIIGYLSAFYFLSLTLTYIPLSVAYAIWGGVGLSIIAILSVVVLKQILDIPAILGILCIITGVLIIHLFSKTIPH